MTAFDADELAELVLLLRAAARAEILPRWRRLEADEVRAKTGPLDLVTVADEAAEHRLTVALRARFPGCLVVGEEAASADPALLDGLEAAELAFVLDPVDGTANFVAGLPLFGSIAAVMVRGEVVAGAIHDPLGDDTAIAWRGGGAWLQAGDGSRRRLRVAAPAPVAAMSGAASWRHLPPAQRAVVNRNLACVAASFDLRCAAHQYRLIAAGGCHYLLFNRPLPWDHAAGFLLHREAGGYGALLDGSAYMPARSVDGGLLYAPDEASWQALQRALLA